MRTRKARLLLEEIQENPLLKVPLELTLEASNLKDLALKESSLLEMKDLSKVKVLERLEEKKEVKKPREEKKEAEKVKEARTLKRLKTKLKQLKTKELPQDLSHATNIKISPPPKKWASHLATKMTLKETSCLPPSHLLDLAKTDSNFTS